MKSSKPSQNTLIRKNSRSDFDSSNQLFRPEFKSLEEQQDDKTKSEKLWSLMSKYIPRDVNTIQTTMVNHIEYTLARTRFNFDKTACYKAAALSVRDRLIEAWNDTQQHMQAMNTKRVYYLSLEFLMGRSLKNALVNIDMENEYGRAIDELGYKLEELYDEERDPGLGNGGLGRLAACFLDSLATLDYPAWGYGIRYNYGIFKQQIINGAQVEVPDYWLVNGNPWEIERNDVTYPIRFYGNVRKEVVDGKERSIWNEGELVYAVAYDNPIPGFNTFNTINLRLWRSEPANQFDFASFNHGDYFKALEARQRAEYISSVLYPNDSTQGGKELRLKQQYFFVSASIQDILRRFKKINTDWKQLPEKVAIQLNDTHPALGILELLRILLDIEKLEMDFAWSLVYQVFAYTNHTVMQEALEKWSVDLLGTLLPRHLELAYLINFFFLERIKKKYSPDDCKISTLSIIEEGTPKKIRMANLCVVGAHTVNGVAELHSELLKTTLFKDFYELFPKKFQNKTNGVTPRRWIACANPEQSDLYTRTLGHRDWLINLEFISQLEGKENDAAFRKEWAEIKLNNKRKLAKWVLKNTGVQINENSLFDIMVKRIHEYKRQLMNVLYVIHKYLQIKEATPMERSKMVPRTVMIGGKAAPAYFNAKLVIKLIGSVSNLINKDKDTKDLLKLVFLPNYSVSNAEVIIPASELSQHISTAGTEASGTSNMKFVMNGCLIIGTMDGANVEIAEEIGKENMFIFGALVDEVEKLREKMRNSEPHEYYGQALQKVFDAVSDGMFGNRDELTMLIDTIRNRNDYYLVCHDFASYIKAQEEVDRVYKDQDEWIKKSIRGSIRSAKFSSDRTIAQYAQEIWKIEPVDIPKPATCEGEVLRVKSYASLKSHLKNM